MSCLGFAGRGKEEMFNFTFANHIYQFLSCLSLSTVSTICM